MTRWAILTGEYPPQPGGVSDYTRLIATGLAAAGDSVAIYAPTHAEPDFAGPHVEVCRLPDRFGPRGLLELDARLRSNPRPDRILIQYVPHAFGWKAMNLPFATWVAHRAGRIAPVWVLFHEVMAGAGLNRPIRNALLTTVTRQMARQVARAAERVFVSIPAWQDLLKRIAATAVSAEWLPIPSSVPDSADSDRTAKARANRPPGTNAIGHFGMFGGMNAELLSPIFASLLRGSSARYVRCIGWSSQGFRDRFATAHPELANRIAATGELSAVDAAANLAACDLLIQPYPDGASTRTNSLMAGLALGVPTVTNAGFLSEPIWGTESAGVSVVPSPDPAAMAAAAEAILALPDTERIARGRASAEWYRSRFAPEITISTLRGPRPRPSGPPVSDRRPPWVLVSAGFHFRGGQAKAVAALASYLARSGHLVHLVGHEFDPTLATAANVIVHPVTRPFRTDALGNILLARAGRAIARKVKAEDSAARVVVNGGNCEWADVNWVHYLHAAFDPDPRAAPRWFRAKEHIIGGWYRRRERRALQSARLVVANSKRTNADVTRCLNLSADRVKTIYYGADPTWTPPVHEEREAARLRFKLPTDRPLVVFVGGFGFDNRKGYDTLLAAWQELCRSPDWDAELVMAGGGKAMGGVASQLSRAGLDRRVGLIGFTDRVFDLLAAADLLVSPVRYEPYGLNVQEAICRGVPAIVSAVAGVAEEYPEELSMAVLANPDNASELAGRLRAWRADIEGWRKRFRPLSDHLRARTWDMMAAEIAAAVSAVPI